VLIPFAIYQSFIDYPMIAGLTLSVAFLFAFIDKHKITSQFQYFTISIVAISMGFIVEKASIGFPFIFIAMIFAVSGLITRMVFIKYFSFTRFRYFELYSLIMVMMLIGAKLYFNHDKWPLFIPAYFVFIMLAMHTMLRLKDSKMLNEGAKNGYPVEAGIKAPDFFLPDQFGNGVKLSDYAGERHILLIFVRGDWCPYCHMLLRTYMRERDRFKEKNIMLMAIGPDPVGINREMAEKLGLDYLVLSDEKMLVARDYGIQLPDFNLQMASDYDEGMPLPASFLVDKNGFVVFTSRTDRVGEFLDPSLIFPVVESLN